MLKVVITLALAFLAVMAFRVYRSWSVTAPPRSSGPSESAALPELPAGTRVKVSPNYHWAQGVPGTVTNPPARVLDLVDDWSGTHRTVQGAKGPLLFYWVHFDSPQKDTEGDGPFFGAEIEARYLEALPSSSLQVPANPEGPVDATWYENERLGKKVEFRAFLRR